MKKVNFFSKATLTKDAVTLNLEALETMNLDTENSKVLIILITNPDKQGKNSKEVLIMKVNGSLCDDPENIKEVFSPDLIKTIDFVHDSDKNIIKGTIKLSAESIKEIQNVFGGEEYTEFKLLVCNSESALGKEFKEQFNITDNYYRFVDIHDKRISIGKEKKLNENKVERININQ